MLRRDCALLGLSKLNPPSAYSMHEHFREEPRESKALDLKGTEEKKKKEQREEKDDRHGDTFYKNSVDISFLFFFS